MNLSEINKLNSDRIANSKTVDFMNGKGGVEKTTTSHALDMQAARTGKNVQLVDSDPKSDLNLRTGITEDVSPRQGLDRLLVNAGDPDAVPGIMSEEEFRKDLYRKDRLEFKKWACKQIGAVWDDRKPGYKYPDGYIDKCNACVMAIQSLSVGLKVYEKAKLFLSNKEKYKHVIIIAFSFDGKIKKLAYGDALWQIKLVTVESLMEDNYAPRLYEAFRVVDYPHKLSRFFTTMKK